MSTGRKQGKSWPVILNQSRPDFVFGELFEAIVEYLSAVVSMLGQLKALPRFA
jgi:hypothetical protein